MNIKQLIVHNFRGIKTLDWIIPDQRIICLIGKGDTTKSTILDAIRYVLFPSWNPSFDELDFYGGETSLEIEIVVTLGDLPESFFSDNKYGLLLRGWDNDAKMLYDEPDDERLEPVITAILKVDHNLEPTWTVFCDRVPDGRPFRVGDRSNAYATFIGAYSDYHLTWSRNSALSHITDPENILTLLSQAARSAKEAINSSRSSKLTSFDLAASETEKIARAFGVPVSIEGAYKAQLDTGAVNIRMGGLSLHDDNMPLRRLGLGSRRMLTFGIQHMGLKNPHITLIDEIEIGLEPHRISRLLKKLGGDENGQYFITTHSPVVLRELSVDQLSVVQCSNGQIQITLAAIPVLADVIQGRMRGAAEAFLSKKILLCEGATEVGLSRGLDNIWASVDEDTFAYHGIATLDGGGSSKLKNTAIALKELGYDVFVLADSDATDFSEADAQALISFQIEVIRWEGGVSVEQFFFNHLPWAKAIDSIQLAIELNGTVVIDQIKTEYPSITNDIDSWEQTPELRDAIGTAAKKSTWFKRIDKAEEWAAVIREPLVNPTGIIGTHISKIKTWVINAATA